MTTLGYALLSLLAREPLSGYDLAQRLRRPVGFFWHAGHSQIYPELNRLEVAGLLEHEVVTQDDRPDKKMYRVTPAGQLSLRAWIAQPMDMPPVRDELVLRAYCLWIADPVSSIALFRDHAQQHAARLANYHETLARIDVKWAADDHRLDVPAFGTYAVLKRGIIYEQGYAEWCTWMADLLEHQLDRHIDRS